jgi:hypothetical protein
MDYARDYGIALFRLLSLDAKNLYFFGSVALPLAQEGRMRLPPRTLLLMVLVLSGYGGAAATPTGHGGGTTVRPSGEQRLDGDPVRLD